jgi:hypothetical protein
MGLGGISIWQLIILVGFIVFIFFSIKVARHSFGFLKKAEKAEVETDSGLPGQDALDLSGFQFIANTTLELRGQFTLLRMYIAEQSGH